MYNCCFDLFKLHRSDNTYQIELIMEPIAKNKIIELTKEDFDRIYERYWYMKKSEDDNTIVYQDDIFDDTRIYHELKQEFKKEFRKYYIEVADSLDSNI